ncbi:hypothetical protein GEMRC1_002837 [Eukaryota sp. GEM-RC1]
MFNWNWSEDYQWYNKSVFFDGFWDISGIYEQDYGRFLFWNNAVISLSSIILLERAHVTINGSRSNGGWEFDLLEVSTNSWLEVTGIKDDFIFKSIIMRSDEFTRLSETQNPLILDTIELYNGMIEFSSGWIVEVETLSIFGGQKIGSDDLIVDHFNWDCGTLQGTGVIYVRKFANISTCSPTIWNPSPTSKSLREFTSLVILPGAFLHLDSADGIFFFNYTFIDVLGNSSFYQASLFAEDTNDQYIKFVGDTVDLIGQFSRYFDVFTIINADFNHYEGSVYFRRELDVYSPYIISSGANVYFTRLASASHRFVFHESSSFLEVQNSNTSEAKFQPLNRLVNVIVKNIQYNVSSITLLGNATLHFHQLSYNFGGVRNFKLLGESTLRLTSGLPFILFNSFGLLTEKAQITGTDQLIIQSESFDSGDHFYWHGGGFSGLFQVYIHDSIEVAGQYPKFIYGGVVLNLLDDVLWETTVSNVLFGNGRSRIVVMPGVVLTVESYLLLQCPNELYIPSCNCLASITIDQGGHLNVTSTVVRSCFSFVNGGNMTIYDSRVELYSSLTSVADVYVCQESLLHFLSKERHSTLDHRSTLILEGEMLLDNGAEVRLEGHLLPFNVPVHVVDGNIQFRADSIIETPFFSVSTRDHVSFLELEIL